MIRSMTGFGRGTGVAGGKEITVEIKSVNNRYTDFSVRVSRMYGFLESKIKTYLQQNGIARGKVEVNCTVNVVESAGAEIMLDRAYAESYVRALRQLRDAFGLTDDISTMTVARNPDLFTVRRAEEDVERDWDDVRPVVDAALADFLRAREKEGAALAHDLLEKTANLRRMTDAIAAHATDAAEAYRIRLETKLRAVLEANGIDAEPDHARIITECALFADKTAIDEELTRLRIHLDTLEQLLQSDEPIGRKIDFLLQEINREINTTGSKVSDVALTALVVDMKSELEKIREQIQNIE